MATNFINNLKSGLRFLNRSKIIVRILLLENQELIVNSQPLCFPLYILASDSHEPLIINRDRQNNRKNFN
ncbi:hypothetical protein CP364_03815 [Lactobacillus sp. UMNPBX13]|nr:hypothetical protein CP364_03815 [Lactobacillus sp. UMNPBX13]